MISIENLLQKPLPGNFFAPDIYLQGDYEFGMLENREGDRLIALPEILLEALYEGLEEEVGPSAGLVLTQCGVWWGKSFYQRFANYVSGYSAQTLAQMPMIDFLQCLKECWKTHGWGIIDIDSTYHQSGYLVIEVKNSPYLHKGSSKDSPQGFIEIGVLKAFFSKLTGQDLDCVQTCCESSGAESSYFILGIADRLSSIKSKQDEGMDHQSIVNELSLLEE